MIDETMNEYNKVLTKVESVLDPYTPAMKEAVGAAVYFDAVVRKALEEAGEQGLDDFEPAKRYILAAFEQFVTGAFQTEETN